MFDAFDGLEDVWFYDYQQDTYSKAAHFAVELPQVQFELVLLHANGNHSLVDVWILSTRARLCLCLCLWLSTFEA